MGGGIYEVYVRTPDENEFSDEDENSVRMHDGKKSSDEDEEEEFFVGTFKVNAPVITPAVPTISPIIGAPGSQFTITDPEGRMQQGDIVVFYVEGTDPAYGNPATNVVISPDGTTLTGDVPGGAVRGTQHYVSVRQAQNMPSRFNDLAFMVTM